VLARNTLDLHADRWKLVGDQRLAHHLAAERLLTE